MKTYEEIREEERKWNEHEAKWYAQQVEFDNNEIKWVNDLIKLEREHDRKLQEWVWGRGVIDEYDMKVFGTGEFIGKQQRAYIRERDRLYRYRARDKKQLEKFTKRLEEL